MGQVAGKAKLLSVLLLLFSVALKNLPMSLILRNLGFNLSQPGFSSGFSQSVVGSSPSFLRGWRGVRGFGGGWGGRQQTPDLVLAV